MKNLAIEGSEKIATKTRRHKKVKPRLDTNFKSVLRTPDGGPLAWLTVSLSLFSLTSALVASVPKKVLHTFTKSRSIRLLGKLFPSGW